MKESVAALLFALSLAACAAQAPAPTPARPETPAPQPPSSEAAVAPGYWNVEQVRCSALIEASDADRAAAAMFYYGYLAAKAGISVIDVTRIDANVAKVMQQCEGTPNLTVPQAFRAALRPQS